MSVKDMLLLAFPSAARSYARPAIAALNTTGELEPSGNYKVNVQGETLVIPYRVYFTRTDYPWWIRAPKKRAVVNALLTRHHNGHVRERHARQLLASDESWVPAFVIKRLGEYVIEIVTLIQRALPTAHAEMYSSFVRANPTFVDLTRQRAISYWDAYYRQVYTSMDDYPGLIALHYLRDLRASAAV